MASNTASFFHAVLVKANGMGSIGFKKTGV
jgi:hypothetical protein